MTIPDRWTTALPLQPHREATISIDGGGDVRAPIDRGDDGLGIVLPDDEGDQGDHADDGDDGINILPIGDDDENEAQTDDDRGTDASESDVEAEMTDPLSPVPGFTRLGTLGGTGIAVLLLRELE